MKKLLLSAAAFAVVAVSAVTVTPTTSEAIPAFARQTGAACLQCHHLTFPTLSAFGRSFKQGAFTDVGELALIEDDALSITSVLNMSIVLRTKFINTAQTGQASVKTTQLPADTVLLFGGRVGSNTGAFIEYEAAFANYQLINSWDAGDGKVGFSIFNSGFGDTFGIEVGSTYGQHGGLFGAKGLTAMHNIDGNAKASVGGTGGVAVFFANDIVTASVSGVTGSAALGVENGWKLAPSARVFAVQDFGGMEFGLGFNITSGSTGNAGTRAALGLNPAITSIKMKKWGVDFQVQGEMGDTGFDFYADYASAAASTATELNLYNSGTTGTLKGYSFRGDVKPLHNVIIGAGYGSLKDNVTKTTRWQIAAEYEIYQNFVAALIYNSRKVKVGGVSTTTNTTTIDIEALM
ncbi:MAG: hypothetical protein Q9M29_10450 [Mariprofundaceae bacterium]|nr:hypothetical protein [Mariprofundaceae bacterium]